MKQNKHYFLKNIISTIVFLLSTHHISLYGVASKKGKDQKQQVQTKNKNNQNNNISDIKKKITKATPTKANQQNTKPAPKPLNTNQKTAQSTNNTPSQKQPEINLPSEIFSDAEVKEILNQTNITDTPVLTNNSSNATPNTSSTSDSSNNNNEIIAVGEILSIPSLTILLALSGNKKIKIKAWKNETERKENVTAALKETLKEVEEKINKSKKKNEKEFKFKEIDETLINEFIKKLQLPESSEGKDIEIKQEINIKDKLIEYSYFDKNKEIKNSINISSLTDIKNIPEIINPKNQNKNLEQPNAHKDSSQQIIDQKNENDNIEKDDNVSENLENANKKLKEQENENLLSIFPEIKLKPLPNEDIFKGELSKIKKNLNGIPESNIEEEEEEEEEGGVDKKNKNAIITFNKDDNTGIKGSNALAIKKNVVNINLNESKDGIIIQNFNYAGAIKNNNIYKCDKNISPIELKNMQQIFNQNDSPLRTILEKLPHINSNVFIGKDGKIMVTLKQNPEEQELPQKAIEQNKNNNVNNDNKDITISYNLNHGIQEQEGIKILVGTNEKPILTLANNEQLEQQIEGKPQAPKHGESNIDNEKISVKNLNENMKVLSDALAGLKKENNRTKEETAKQYKALIKNVKLKKPLINANKEIDDFNLNKKTSKNLLDQYTEQQQLLNNKKQETRILNAKIKSAKQFGSNLLTGNGNFNGINIAAQDAINNKHIKDTQIAQMSSKYEKLKPMHNTVNKQE